MTRAREQPATLPYDYYQPAAYIPQTDTYIEKDASINVGVHGRELASVSCLRWLADSFLLSRPHLAEGAHVACAAPIVNRSRRPLSSTDAPSFRWTRTGDESGLRFPPGVLFSSRQRRNSPLRRPRSGLRIGWCCWLVHFLDAVFQLLVSGKGSKLTDASGQAKLGDLAVRSI